MLSAAVASTAIESALPPLSDAGPLCSDSGGIGDLGALWPAEESWALPGGTSYSSSLPGAEKKSQGNHHVAIGVT